jgi:hypothetical protein
MGGKSSKSGSVSTRLKGKTVASAKPKAARAPRTSKREAILAMAKVSPGSFVRLKSGETGMVTSKNSRFATVQVPGKGNRIVEGSDLA